MEFNICIWTSVKDESERRRVFVDVLKSVLEDPNVPEEWLSFGATSPRGLINGSWESIQLEPRNAIVQLSTLVGQYSNPETILRLRCPFSVWLLDAQNG